jgi:hypothetical protein
MPQVQQSTGLAEIFSEPLAVTAHTDYWVGFEVPASSTFSGVIMGSAPKALEHEAINFVPAGYISRDEINIGVRVYGSPVPIPGALLLLGAGLLRLAHYRRRNFISSGFRK